MSLRNRVEVQAVVAAVAMLLGVLAIYLPLSLLSGDETLFGIDFWSLHIRRMQFVQEYWAQTGSWTLPAWYPREFMGSPFWSNIQSFPWIPTRLVLLFFDPALSYAVGVNLAAALAASFTFLFLRTSGWAPAPSAVAGWTFASAGFFASRVTAGHLPLLEAYPALPLLLWLAERARRNPNDPASLAALAFGTASVAVAGHPQLSTYAVASALLYLLWMDRRERPFFAMGAIVLGAASTLAVWYPMLLLLGRSTRVLPLQAAGNDLSLPFSRLGALILPWKDGWPLGVQRVPPQPFDAGVATFWDTVNYVGILPWLAVVALCVVWARGRRRPPDGTWFVAALGAGGLLLALPMAQEIASLVPGTFLRSPARLLYLTGFALSVAAGGAFQLVLRSRWPSSSKARVALAVLILAIHVFDLAQHDRAFIHTRPRALRALPAAEVMFDEELHAGRVAIDYNLSLAVNRRFDDVGVFDGILLARPYRAILALRGLPDDTNVQDFSGSTLSRRSLSNLGARFVITQRERPDLIPLNSGPDLLYEVPDPVARAKYFPTDRVRFLDEPQTLRRLRRKALDLGKNVSLPAVAAATSAPPASGELEEGQVGAVVYDRPHPDKIDLTVTATLPGFVRVLESWDPGWHAVLDGTPTPTLTADGFAIAVQVPAGEHEIELEYRTPGAAAGVMLSMGSLVLLGLLLVGAARLQKNRP